MPVLATVAGQRIDGMEDFMQAYVDSITPAEWQTLSQLPPIERTTVLITVTSTLRTMMSRELPEGHPLAAIEEVSDERR